MTNQPLPRLRLLAGAVLACLAPSCASIATGSEDSVLVLSEPSGAHFKTNTGHRGTTPSTILIPDDVVLKVDYSLTGYHKATAELAPQMSGWVFGNLILGGLIGIVIDFGSGNYRTHADSVCATLAPAPKTTPTSAPVKAKSDVPAVWTGYEKQAVQP